MATALTTDLGIMRMGASRPGAAFLCSVCCVFWLFATDAVAGQGAAAPTAVRTAAQVVVDHPVIDLGTIGYGVEPTAGFLVRNTGTTALDLALHSKSPGLRLVDAPTRLEAGQSGRIRLTIDTFSAGATTQWEASFSTTDPATPFLALTVKADVRQFIAVVTPTARFSFVQFGAEGGTTHVVGALDDAGMDVLGVDSPFPYIRADVKELTEAERSVEIPADRQWRVSLTISPDAPVGPIGGVAVIRTTHPAQPRAFIAVSGFVRPLIAVTPPAVELQPLQTSSDLPILTLLVKNFGAEPLDISSPVSDVPGLEARIIPVERGHVWRIELRAGAGWTTGGADGVLRFRTTHPSMPQVSVPIRKAGPIRKPGR